MYIKGEENIEGLKGCLMCRLGLHRNSYSPGNERLYLHHIEGSETDKWGNKKGRTIPLCGSHHKQVHVFAKNEAVRLALKNDDNFYVNCLNKQLEKESEHERTTAGPH